MGDLPRLCWKHYIMLYSIYAIFLKERKKKLRVPKHLAQGCQIKACGPVKLNLREMSSD